MHVFAVPLHAANAALVAVVVISLNAVVKEVAHGTKIGGELHAAFIIHACVGHGLSVIALITHHLFDGVPVHFVGLSFIMTVATRILFVATRRNQAASAHVVLATNHFFFFFFFLCFFLFGFVFV
jgi:hypothetical protein